MICEEGRRIDMSVAGVRSLVGAPSISVRGLVAVGCKNRLLHMGDFLV